MGDVVDTEEGIQKVAVDYFSNLFTSDLDGDVQFSSLHMDPRVTETMNEYLCSPFVAEEVSVALKSMHPTKAPGPDGFPALFYQRYWDTVGSEVTKICLETLNNGIGLEVWNRTNIALIPKCPNPESMKEFRPISLCNVIYKLMSKMVANRLKRLLPDIISETQSTFVAGRHITDNIMVSFECFHSLTNRRKGRNGCMALKLDISKAYDRVEWRYLDFIMEKMGFCSQWRSLIMQCVSTVKFSTLINGQQTMEFTPTRGIRQRDPISPYLFLLCAEGFSSLLQEANDAGGITGIKPSPRGPSVSHLLFCR